AGRALAGAGWPAGKPRPGWVKHAAVSRAARASQVSCPTGAPWGGTRAAMLLQLLPRRGIRSMAKVFHFLRHATHARAERARVSLFHAEEAKTRKSRDWAGPHHERAVKRLTNPSKPFLAGRFSSARREPWKQGASPDPSAAAGPEPVSSGRPTAPT